MDRDSDIKTVPVGWERSQATDTAEGRGLRKTSAFLFSQHPSSPAQQDCLKFSHQAAEELVWEHSPSHWVLRLVYRGGQVSDCWQISSFLSRWDKILNSCLSSPKLMHRLNTIPIKRCFKINTLWSLLRKKDLARISKNVLRMKSYKARNNRERGWWGMKSTWRHTVEQSCWNLGTGFSLRGAEGDSPEQACNNWVYFPNSMKEDVF